MPALEAGSRAPAVIPGALKLGRLVVVSQLCDQQVAILRSVDHPVLLGDAAGPVSRESEAQRLRLPNAGKGAPARVLNEFVDAFEHLRIGFLPAPVILPCP